MIVFKEVLYFRQLVTFSNSFSFSATIENFNIVETLSDNAAIIYQTHKVSAAKISTFDTGLCCSGFKCVTMSHGVTAGMACISEGRVVSVCNEEDLGQQRE